MGKIYDGIYRISFLIDVDGKIEYVFDDFKISNYYDVVLNWLKEYVWLFCFISCWLRLRLVYFIFRD